MLLQKEREEVAHYGRKLIESGLTTGTGGNLSICNREKMLVAIKPSGMDYFDIQPADVVVMDMQGQVVEGARKPSSEMRFHLGLFRHRSEITAVVHTHSVYATTVACLNRELPAVHYLVAHSGNKVPLAPYATYGTTDLSENILKAMGAYNACLLANHGLVTVGVDMATAFTVAEQVELVARIYCQAKAIGEPVILSDDEMVAVCNQFKTYGQKK